MKKIVFKVREAYRMPMLIIHEFFHCLFTFILFLKLPLVTITKNENGNFYGHCSFVTSKKRYSISCISPIFIIPLIVLGSVFYPFIFIPLLIYSITVYKYSMPSRRDWDLFTIYIKGRKSIDLFFEKIEKDEVENMKRQNIMFSEIPNIEL